MNDLTTITCHNCKSKFKGKWHHRECKHCFKTRMHEATINEALFNKTKKLHKILWDDYAIHLDTYDLKDIINKLLDKD